jgi:hypothetical protein
LWLETAWHHNQLRLFLLWTSTSCKPRGRCDRANGPDASMCKVSGSIVHATLTHCRGSQRATRGLGTGVSESR